MRRVTVDSAARFLITASVGGIGAAAGFTHTHDAAVAAGQQGLFAWADAVVIECMVVVAGLQYVKDRKAGTSVALPAFVLVISFLIQMGAQVAGAPASFAGWLFAAVPALGCLVCLKFGLRSAGKPESEEVASEVDESVVTHAAARVDTIAHAMRVEEPEFVREIAPAVPAVQVRSEPVAAVAAAWPPSS